MARCYYCDEEFDDDKIHLDIDFGNENERVCPKCMFEYLFRGHVCKGNASEFIVALTEGFHEFMKGKVK